VNLGASAVSGTVGLAEQGLSSVVSSASEVVGSAIETVKDMGTTAESVGAGDIVLTEAEAEAPGAGVTVSVTTNVPANMEGTVSAPSKEEVGQAALDLAEKISLGAEPPSASSSTLKVGQEPERMDIPSSSKTHEA
jgi:hypothetical protein